MSNAPAVIVHHPTDTALSIAADQATFSDAQVAALRHMGVDEAGPGDLEVFFHVVKRTGLDPFARQIHMIGRNSKNQRTQQWEVKYTIQTGIDGYRLIGRRAADRTRETISLAAPEWAHEDGSWRPVWSTKWGMPVAARVTLTRGASPFTAVAIFDEYKQTKRDGGLTSMWAQRPAGQLAKCAEALAWRMAFPQDLAGIYVDDEMGQADNGHEATAKPQGMAGLRAAVAPEPAPEPVEYVQTDPEPDGITSGQQKKMGALMREVGITQREHALAYVNDTIGREVASRSELTKAEAGKVIDALEADAATDQPPADDTPDADPGAPWGTLGGEGA